MALVADVTCSHHMTTRSSSAPFCLLFLLTSHRVYFVCLSVLASHLYVSASYIHTVHVYKQCETHKKKRQWWTNLQNAHLQACDKLSETEIICNVTFNLLGRNLTCFHWQLQATLLGYCHLMTYIQFHFSVSIKQSITSKLVGSYCDYIVKEKCAACLISGK